MLEDAAGIRRVVIACGYVDLRKGIDGLSMIIGGRYHQNPFEKGTLFLFCGRRSDRIKRITLLDNKKTVEWKPTEEGLRICHIRRSSDAFPVYVLRLMRSV